jgi:hypothetical protein
MLELSEDEAEVPSIEAGGALDLEFFKASSGLGIGGIATLSEVLAELNSGGFGGAVVTPERASEGEGIAGSFSMGAVWGGASELSGGGVGESPSLVCGVGAPEGTKSPAFSDAGTSDLLRSSFGELAFFADSGGRGGGRKKSIRSPPVSRQAAIQR